MATKHYRRIAGAWRSLENAPDIISPSKIMMGASAGYESIESMQTKSSATVDLARRYDSGFNTNFATTTGAASDVGQRGTIYSFKPDMSLLAVNNAGAIGSLNSLIDSIPAGHKTWLCAWHEPEDNFPDSASQALYRTGWANFAAVVHSKNRPELQTIWIMTTSCFRIGGTNYFYYNYIPDNFDVSVDVIGYDDYNGGSLRQPQRWDSPGMGLGRPYPGESLKPFGGGFAYPEGGIGWAKDHNKKIIMCEWGSIVNHNAPTPQWCIDNKITASKAAWIEYGVEWMSQQPEIIGLCYFNSFGRTWTGDGAESWEFYHGANSLDYQAWGRAVNSHATGGLS
jgi:hypothetical protein